MTDTRQSSWVSVKGPGDGIEWASAYFRGLAFTPHRHDTYAIGTTTVGVQAFDYRGEGRHALAGDVFVLHPDELHDGRQGTDEGYGYRIAYLSPERVADALGGGPLPFVAAAVTRDPGLRALLASGFPDPDDAADEMCRSEAVTVFAELLNRLAGRPGSAGLRADHARLRRVREHLLAALPGSVGLARLEREHGIDRYTLSRQFRRSFGVSPHRFVTLRRLDLAKRHIREGESLAEAAAHVGFADQSHMTRHFRRAVGLSPGIWRDLLGPVVAA